MHILFLLLLNAAGIQAAEGTKASKLTGQQTESTTSGDRSSCPAVWSTISSDLTTSFVSGGQCTDMARAAIRYAFHDAATFSTKLPYVAPASGGADGSLLLNGEEIGRAENSGLQNYHNFITGKFAQYKSQGVGAADLIQFASNHAIVSCPGGPTISTRVGRTDSFNPAPIGLLPIAFGAGSDHNTLFQLFSDKGFSAVDLAALVGAHTTSRAFTRSQVPVGASQDSTPGVWDVKYYSETYKPPPGVGRFESDINLSNPNTTVGKEFQSFVNNQGKWTANFASAMFQMSMLGISPSTYNNFVDCTSALPRHRRRRNVLDEPIDFRIR
jgi:manganese peroxidase